MAAGELAVHGGRIRFFDNVSGHYRPAGVEPQRAAEDASGALVLMWTESTLRGYFDECGGSEILGACIRGRAHRV